MKKKFITIVSLAIIAAASSAWPAVPRCNDSDGTCKEFEVLTEAGKESVLLSKVRQGSTYSEGARYFIGKAYLALAADETNTPEQEEAYCRKALEYGATQAYMGLYFLTVQKDEEQALGYLRDYIKTKPLDPVAYVILGESELDKKNYQVADVYLREAKKISRASSPRVAWMLFQANYLLGNYRYAGEMFEAALSNGFEKEVKALASDVRFKGIAQRPEFKKFEQQLSSIH
jgi:tetratricopeptide (TPR) repeat protein